MRDTSLHVVSQKQFGRSVVESVTTGEAISFLPGGSTSPP